MTAIKNDGPASKSELQVRDKILQVYYINSFSFSICKLFNELL